MENTNERTHRRSGWLTWMLRGLLVVLLILLLAVWLTFGGELRTVASVKRVEENTPLFTMDYKGDYGLEKFLAEGGADSDADLVAFVVRQVLHGLPMEFDLPDLGCSTYAAHLSDGTPIFGRNFDMYDSPAMLVTTRPKDGYASLSMVNLAYIGYDAEHLPDALADRIMALAAPYVPLDGVNEKGLAVGVLLIETESTHQDTGRPDITTTSAIRLMLDRAATVDEAIALLESYDMHASANSCYHFHIADAQGNSVVVEYIGDEMSVIRSEAATNFLLTPGDFDFGKGQDRFKVLEEKLAYTNGTLRDTEEAMALLEAVSQKPVEGKDSSTPWSCVYDQKEIGLDVAIDMDYDTVYHFEL